ncbi:MAG: protein kinase [Clostridiales bacterium]|nr:protein kinase [Clostridiales bacterium]
MTDWDEGQILFDDLRLDKAIGRGAFGEVWRARQLSWDRDVAVKRVSVPDERRIRSLEQEAIHWLEIGLHPYVTTCYYTRRHEGAPVIVLEYASEGALDGWIKDERLLFEENAVEQILKFSLEAAWGLACAHRTGLLHLDVKPANILVEGGAAKITDFGIASQLGEDAVSPGTRAFASPEQLSLEEVSGKSDVFSWAVTVFVLFRHEVSWAVGIAAPEVLDDEWQLGALPLDMPESVYRLLLCCMSEDPAERPSMEAAADTLHEILQAEFPAFPVPAKTIDRQPLTAAEYNNRAVYMYETGDLAKAGEYFRKAVETAVDVTVPQFNKGLVDYYAGRLTPTKLLEERMNTGLDTEPGTGPGKELDTEPGTALGKASGTGPDNEPGKEPGTEPGTGLDKGLDTGPGTALDKASGTGPDNEPGKEPGTEPGTGLDKGLDTGPSTALDKASGTGPGKEPGTAPGKTPTTFTAGHAVAARVHMLNGDARSIAESPEIAAASPAAQAWLANGAPGALAIGELKSIACPKGADRGKIQDILTQGSLSIFNRDRDRVPVEMIMSPRRQALLLINNKGAVLLGGLGPGKAPWAACMIQRDKLRISEAQFIDEDRVFYRDKGLESCDFSDPENLVYSAIPPAARPSGTNAVEETRVSGSFAPGFALIRHSKDYHGVSDRPASDTFEYTCLWRISPYRILTMVLDEPPAAGGSLVLENGGEFFISRIDKTGTPPPDKAEWLMMEALSGAEAKDRRDVVRRATEDYDLLLSTGDYGGVVALAERIRPLLESLDENALALWQRISRDFPRGDPVMAAECEAVRSKSEVASVIKIPPPVFAGMNFSRPSAIGKIRFTYTAFTYYKVESTSTEPPPSLIVANGISEPREFPPVGFFRKVGNVKGSDDGLFQALVYSMENEEGVTTKQQKGIMVRVMDVRAPECVFEITRLPLQIYDIFICWFGHTLLIYFNSEGLYAINFDNAGNRSAEFGNVGGSGSIGGAITELPKPLIPSVNVIEDPAFMGEHADELHTGANRWRLCFEILPFPERPMDDPRLEDIRKMLPRKPAEKRAMLLRNGFGNLWTDMILKGR